MITSDTCATTDLVLWELSEQICRLGYILSPSLAPAERNYLVHHFQLREVEGWKSAWQGYCPPSSLLDAGQPLLVPATIQLLTERKLHKPVSGNTYVQTDTKVPLLASGQKYLVWMDMQICKYAILNWDLVSEQGRGQWILHVYTLVYILCTLLNLYH